MKYSELKGSEQSVQSVFFMNVMFISYCHFQAFDLGRVCKELLACPTF
jgi:hypothetical protein